MIRYSLNAKQIMWFRNRIKRCQHRSSLIKDSLTNYAQQHPTPILRLLARWRIVSLITSSFTVGPLSEAAGAKLITPTPVTPRHHSPILLNKIRQPMCIAVKFSDEHVTQLGSELPTWIKLKLLMRNHILPHSGCFQRNGVETSDGNLIYNHTETGNSGK